MELSKENLSNENSIITIGPLILDTRTNSAATSWNMELLLTEEEFRILCLLAKYENISLSAEELYIGLRLGNDFNRDKEDTRKTIEKLINKVNSIGIGFMWININDDRYTFRTKWGHNKASWADTGDIPKISKISDTDIPVTAQRKNFRLDKLLLVAGTIAACLALSLLVYNIVNAGQNDSTYFKEPQVPLAQISPEDYYCDLCESCEKNEEGECIVSSIDE